MGARDIKKGGIIYRLYKELLKISKRNAKFPIKKKERIKLDNIEKRMLTGLTSLVIGEL